MSFVNRKLYKQKPQAWGPVSSVQASIFKNAESIGIDPASIVLAMPMWGPGDQLDYAKYKIGQNTSATFQNNSLRFNGAASVYMGGIDLTMPAGSPFTALVHGGNITGVDSYGILIGGRLGSGAGDLWKLQRFYNYSIKFEYDPTGSGGSVYPADYSLTNAKRFLACGVYDGNSISVKIYGNFYTSSTLTGKPNAAIDQDNIAIGRRADSTSEYLNNTDIDLVCLFSLALSDSQIAYISDTPYYLLQRVPPVFYSVPGGAITITTSLDGKVIIRTATAALLDCMTSIKNNASNILDCAAAVLTTKTDAIDGKTILKSVAASVFDSKASVLSVASLLLDGNTVVSDIGTEILDGKGTVKDSTYNIVDGKSIINSTNTAILDGKSIFLSAGTTVIDGKIIVNAEGFSSSLLDGKTSIKAVATNYLDGLIYIGNAADKNIDGKAIIKSEVCLSIDGKTTIQDVASNLLDGSASIMTSIANIVDGKIIISDAAIGLIDGKASLLDDSNIVMDGKVFLSSGSEINVFDGKITLSVPIVGKVTVSFSMRSPSVSFAIRTPAATVSIN